MIDYILIEPKEDDPKKGHRYPFISSEILNSDSNKIFDLFFKSATKNSVDLSVKKSIEIEESKKEKDEITNFNFDEKNEILKKNDSDLVLEKEEIKSNDILKVEEKDVKIQNGEELKIEELLKSDLIEKNINNQEIKNDVIINQNDVNVNNLVEVPENKIEKNQIIENFDHKNDVDAINDIKNDGIIKIDNEIKIVEKKDMIVEIEDKIKEKKILEETIQEHNTKQEIEKIEFDLMDYFLSFLDSNSELNYVLCGYFSKFFNTLFNKNSVYVI